MKSPLKLIKYLFLLAAALIIVVFALVAASYQDLKTSGRYALASKNSLTQAASAAQNRQWDEALTASKTADEQLIVALAGLDKVKGRAVFKYIKPLRAQLDDLEYLLKTADLINRSLERGLPLAKSLSDIYDSSSSQRFASLSAEDKSNFFQLIYESEPEINGLRANLDLARLNLDKIRRIGILWPIYGQISDLKKELEEASRLLSQTTPLIRLLPAFAGHPSPSDFLIIMHNTDELRPSGGFIGVFGLLTTDSGDITSLQTYDSYHLDMPAVGKWIMEPPAPIKKYMKVQNWYLRDANWSPDWPTSARQILDIYAGESRAISQESPDFTGVIGITPEFVSDLLRLVGPIEVRGETYTPENLQSLLQYSVEVAYIEQGISSWDRKDVVNDLLAELKTRLFALEASRLPELLDVFGGNIETKGIQLYFQNPNWQSLATDLGGEGSIKEVESDYLLVVDANLAAFKTDAVMDKGIEYEVNLQADKSALAGLKLSYKHNGGFDWRTTRYRSYTRVYVPRGSSLIEIRALEQVNLEAESISSYDDVNLNKTVFAFFFSVEPGQTGAIKLDYKLPERIALDLESQEYELLVQHQAGRRTEKCQVLIKGTPYSLDLDRDRLLRP